MPAEWSPGVASAGTVIVTGTSARAPGSRVTVVPIAAMQATSSGAQTALDPATAVQAPRSVEAASALMSVNAAVS